MTGQSEPKNMQVSPKKRWSLCVAPLFLSSAITFSVASRSASTRKQHAIKDAQSRHARGNRAAHSRSTRCALRSRKPAELVGGADGAAVILGSLGMLVLACAIAVERSHCGSRA